MSKIQQTQQTHAQVAAKANKARQQQNHSVNPTQMLESPESLRPADVLAAQQTVGNQVVQRALDKDDRRKGLTDNQGNLRQDLNEQIQQKRGGGSPLPEAIQKEASKKLGRNFKDVRIHTDESADKLSRTISARAFTIGKDIFFKNGVFAPGSSAGRETIIHELTHVVQQGGKSASGALKLGKPDTAQEKEADRIGKKHAASLGSAPAGAVQREGEEDELMMQEEEEELLQMQEEEEELQMQGDDDLDDDFDGPIDEPSDSDIDDDIMMQGEEDELQMQTDTSNVIQREKQWIPDENDKEKWVRNPKFKKPDPNAPIPDAPAQPTIPAVTQPKSGIKMKKGYKSIRQARKAMGISSLAKKTDKDKHDETLKQLEQDQSEKTKKLTAKVDSSKIRANLPEVKKAKAESDTKAKWLATLKDPKASKDDIKMAKEKLGEFHKDVGKKDFKAAKKERKTALQEAAKSGDEKAYATYKAEKEDTFGGRAKKAWSKEVGTPVKSFAKNLPEHAIKGVKGLGMGIGNLIAGAGKQAFGGGLSHFFGAKKEEKKAEAPAEKKDEGGGEKKDSGIGAIMEKYAEMLQENKKLKEELAGLKKDS